ncbi:hypothetical protein RJI07_04790 [Mycoplasmatota bacterium WC30]
MSKSVKLTYGEIIEQLESLEENSEDFAKSEEPGSIWHKDVRSLIRGIQIIRDYQELMSQIKQWKEFLLTDGINSKKIVIDEIDKILQAQEKVHG